MKTTYKNLHLFIQDSKKEPIGCGYYYIVTCGAMPHTAFRTKRAFKEWLSKTGLRIGKRTGWNRSRSVMLVGEYTEECVMLNNIEFFKEYGHLEPTYNLCNGDYTIGFIDRQTNTIYSQNPNTDRFIFDHRITESIMETGNRYRYL
jgi:hypothetical protein